MKKENYNLIEENKNGAQIQEEIQLDPKYAEVA